MAAAMANFELGLLTVEQKDAIIAACGDEKIMLDFINGEIDVLVSTTIIETGLDHRRGVHAGRSGPHGCYQPFSLCPAAGW